MKCVHSLDGVSFVIVLQYHRYHIFHKTFKLFFPLFYSIHSLVFSILERKSFRTYLKFGDNLSLKLIMKIGVLLKCSMILSFSFACVVFFFLPFPDFIAYAIFSFSFPTHTKHWLVGLCASEFPKSFLLV